MKFFFFITIIVTVYAIRKDPYHTQSLGQYCINGKEYCQPKYVCSLSPKHKGDFKKDDQGICMRPDYYHTKIRCFEHDKGYCMDDWRRKLCRNGYWVLAECDTGMACREKIKGCVRISPVVIEVP